MFKQYIGLYPDYSLSPGKAFRIRRTDPYADETPFQNVAATTTSPRGIQVPYYSTAYMPTHTYPTVLPIHSRPNPIHSLACGIRREPHRLTYDKRRKHLKDTHARTCERKQIKERTDGRRVLFIMLMVLNYLHTYLKATVGIIMPPYTKKREKSVRTSGNIKKEWLSTLSSPFPPNTPEKYYRYADDPPMLVLIPVTKSLSLSLALALALASLALPPKLSSSLQFLLKDECTTSPPFCFFNAFASINSLIQSIRSFPVFRAK